MKDWYCGDDDDGGVHYNGGIVTSLFLRYADKTSVDNARSIWNVLTRDKTYLSPFTDVRGLREAFLHAIDDTLGPTRPRALEALDEVGLTPSSSIPTC
jgi:Zn-dependent metalloprotease